MLLFFYGIKFFAKHNDDNNFCTVSFTFIYSGSADSVFKRFKKNKAGKKGRRKKKSSSFTGQFSEQLAPYLPDFPCNPSQVKFLGKPVDFVAFVEDPDTSLVEEILFIEVKTGTSKLTDREQSIKNTIAQHKVKFVEYIIEKTTSF